MSANKSTNLYEVLSPWAEVDPAVPRGISPRLASLGGKRVGLFMNNKVAGAPIQDIVEAKLKERFPSIQTSRFVFEYNLEVVDTEEKDRFKNWMKGLDAAITAVGD